MEGLGKKLKEARIARDLTLEEAGRLTKIRPGRLEEIENEDFSQFASLAYAKGFLLIYGKFLDVDVTPYLEAFETSEHMTVDGYAYLQDNPAPTPSRPVVVRRERSSSRGSLLPFVIGVVVLVVGFTVMKMILDIQRIKPRDPATTPANQMSPGSTATPTDKIIAPRAQPADNQSPPTTATPGVAPVAAPTIVPPTPAETAAPIAAPSASEPEIRRAEAVRPQDLATPTPTPRPRRVRPRTPPPFPVPVPVPVPIATPRRR